MKPAAKITALFLAGATAAAPLAALAGTAPEPMPPSPQPSASSQAAPSQSQALIKTSDAALTALRDVRAARLAIFNGNTAQADKLTKAALHEMDTAVAKDHGLAVTLPNQKAGPSYIPIDVSVSLADGFVPTPDQTAKIAEANGHMAKGETKAAVEVLRLANIGVQVSAAMVPTTPSVADLTSAAQLIGQGKFYQANLALKKVEDGVVLNSFGLDSLPVQS